MTASERSQSRKVLIGAAIAAGMVIFTMLIFFIPDLVRQLRPSVQMVVLMDDAGALREQSPVWLAGREVGRVVAVAFRGAQTDSTERVAVRLRIPRKYAAHIRSDSRARITSQRLIGEPVLDISPGSPGAPPLQPSDSLRVQPRATLLALLENTERLDRSFADLFAAMRAARPPAARRVDDLRRIDRGLNASFAGLQTLIDALNQSPVRLLSDPEWRRLLDRVSRHGRELEGQLRAAAQRARAAHSDAQPALSRLAARADTITEVLDGMRERVAAGGGGLLIRAQRDSALVKGLHEASVQLDSLIAETKRNPLRFWF